MAPAGDAAQDGLFQGMTFWLSQKVPLRKEIIKGITENGGSIAKQDKDAEILIAEPKQGIPGSYATAFVLDAIREKRLPNRDEYLNRPPPSATQPAGHNAKATRTAFTNDDDAELIAWVLPTVEVGGKIKGNELYQDLANRNNRHTAQSWRDRFVKKYADHPIEQLRVMASRHKQGPAQPAQNLPPLPLPPLPGRGTPLSTKTQRPAVKKRNHFTPEEDEAFREALQDLPVDGKLAWFQDYAKEHPTHTGTAWYHHYNKFIKPSLESARSSRVQPSPRRGADPSPVARRTRPTSTPAKPPPPRSNPPDDEVESESGQDAADVERRDFFEKLKTFMAGRGTLNNNVDFEPTIERYVVDLYQLFNLVDESESEPNELNAAGWAGIATNLGLDCNGGKSVPLKTRKIWDVYLHDFYESLEPEDESQEEEEEEEEKEGGLSPHSSLGRKRVLEPEPELPSKRVRSSRNEEIASTPVSKVRGGNKPVRSPSLAAPTPSGQSRHLPATPVADEDGDDNITPSQQLHDEEAEITPIPIQLEGPSSRRRSNISRPAPDSPVASREDSEPPVQDDGMAELASQCERFEALGYSADDIKTALRATTFDIGLAGYVMEHYLKQKKKLPTNMEGVWTRRDDDGLRFVDGLPSRMDAGDGEEDDANRRRRKAEWKRLVDKHTKDRIQSRRDYQALAGEVGRAED